MFGHSGSNTLFEPPASDATLSLFHLAHSLALPFLLLNFRI